MDLKYLRIHIAKQSVLHQLHIHSLRVQNRLLRQLLFISLMCGLRLNQPKLKNSFWLILSQVYKSFDETCGSLDHLIL